MDALCFCLTFPAPTEASTYLILCSWQQSTLYVRRFAVFVDSKIVSASFFMKKFVLPAGWVTTFWLWHLTRSRTRARGRLKTFRPGGWRASCRTCCTPSLASSASNQMSQHSWRHAMTRRRRRCYWSSTTLSALVDVLRQHVLPPRSSLSTALVNSAHSISPRLLVRYTSFTDNAVV